MNRNTISIRISQQNETERIGILLVLCGVCDIVLESAPTVWIGILLVLVSANKTNRNRNTISISISQQNETERIGILLVLESAPTVWIGILLVLVSANRTNRNTITSISIRISSNCMNRNTISISQWWWYLGGCEVFGRGGCLCNTYKKRKIRSVFRLRTAVCPE